jgi:hypothetical protein
VVALRKARKSVSPPLSVKLPSRKVRESFLIIYELEGCQKAVNYLTKYYGARRMRIVLNGKRVGKSCLAWYLENQACFKKEGLNRPIVLHELYHHLVEMKKIEMPLRIEEKEANYYAFYFLRR